LISTRCAPIISDATVNGIYPIWTVLREGGPWHTRGHLREYLERLRETGRTEWAERLSAAHRDE